MNEKYIMINGKRIDLTDEQIEKLGLEVTEQSCFERKPYYYYITDDGSVDGELDSDDIIDEGRYNVANYCTDEKLMEKRALYEKLDRLLWRFSLQNEGDKLKLDDTLQRKYRIYYEPRFNRFDVDWADESLANGVYFYSLEIAHRAIDEVILPFIKEHGKFVW